RVWEWVAKYAAPEKLLIASAGMPSVHETVELTRRAADRGYKAIWLANSETIYVTSVADRSPIPVIANTEHPNVIRGVATSGAELAQAFADGANAAIVAFANAAPYTAISIWEAHRTREYDAAMDWQNRIARAVELTTKKYGVSGLKHAMDLNGYYG